MEYHIAGNFRGRKLSRISRIGAVPQKFSPWILWGRGTHGRRVVRNTWQAHAYSKVSSLLQSIHPVQRVLAQVLSDKLIATKAWWSPIDDCSLFEYHRCQQDVKQVRQARGGKISGHRHPSVEYMKTSLLRRLRRHGPEMGSGVWCDSWRKVPCICLNRVGAPHLQACCSFSQSAGYGRWWVWLST